MRHLWVLAATFTAQLGDTLKNKSFRVILFPVLQLIEHQDKYFCSVYVHTYRYLQIIP